MGTLFETKSGGPDIEEGVYPGTVKAITPDRVTPKFGPNAGIEGPVFRWEFTLDETDPETDEPIGVDCLSSTNTGPRSKIVEFLTALLGAKGAEPGIQFSEDDLIGKRALIQITKDDAGYLKIAGLTAMPRTARTVRAAVAPSKDEEEESDLPF